MLVDVSPTGPTLNGANMPLIYPVLLGNLSLQTRIGSDGADYLGRNFRCVMLHAAPVAPLGGHVFVVGIPRSKKEMCGVAARRVVAAVQNAQTRSDGTDKGFVSGPRCQSRPLTRAGSAVPVRVAGRSPRPARIWTAGTINIVIEALFRSPVARALESLYCNVSHGPAPSQRQMVRVGVRASNTARLANYAAPAKVGQL